MFQESIVIMILCTFCLIPLVLGEKARNSYSNTFEGFVLNGRKLRMLPMYFTVFSTWMSAFAFLGGISYFFTSGPLYMATIGWDLLYAVLFITIGKRIWFYGKKRGYMTVVDYFNDIYGSRALNICVTIITIVGTLFYLDAQLTAATMVITLSSDNRIPIMAGGLIFFAIIILYLWIGGLRAVALTDIFYCILIITAILGAGFYLMNRAGGVEHVFQQLAMRNRTAISIQGNEQMSNYIKWVAMFLILPLGGFMSPPIWIRNYASSSARNFNMLPFLLALSSIICIGTLFSGSALQILNSIFANPDAILIDTLKSNASPYFTTFIIIGIFAAIFSTANSLIHALASSFTNDIYRKYINRNAPDKVLTATTRMAIIGVCFISYCLMLLMNGSIFDMATIGLGAMAQLIVPVAGSLFYSRSNSRAAIGGVTTGLLMTAVLIIIGFDDVAVCAALALVFNAYIFILFSYIGKQRADVASKIEAYRLEFESYVDNEE